MIRDLAELDRVRGECRQLVTTRALAAAATSIIPIPGIDIAADVGLLTNLLGQINEHFGLSERQIERLDPQVGEKALLVAAGLGNGVIGRAVSKRIVSVVIKRVAKRLAVGSLAKYVPLAGSAISAALGFSAMKLAGNSHIDDCYRTAHALLQGGARSTNGRRSG